MNSKLRVIGGNWRSRQIEFDEVDGLRPTASRIRETLFNWLQNDVAGSSCLDLFAGSGALSFEAASRGAKKVCQVENNARVCRKLHENALKLSANAIKVRQRDAFQFLSGEAEPFNLVFIDPPFHKGLAIQSCQWLDEKGWLTAHAKIYLEVERGLSLDGIPAQWQCLKQKSAGEVDYYLFQRPLKIGENV
ncbi:MAG: 16S rRNA (guanine(966)-N(2))-methyltransferase RsmD [Methylococcales bacterium]|nr:16S rRNA (guanine(966)-N(2))-methyltransferase RsmD [Methylococcales bacterium]